MYVKKNYGFWMTFNWSKKPFILGLSYAGVICFSNYYFSLKFSLPWEPIGVIGIAVAFYLGFKNNSSYDRTWEARKIYGILSFREVFLDLLVPTQRHPIYIRG
jgi:putative membrane protein